MKKIDVSKCPLCGKANDCAIAKGAKDCWCMNVKISAHRLLEIPATHTGKECLCQDCASKPLSASGTKEKSKLFQRPATLSEVANRILGGADAGMEIKDFLHEFHDRGRFAMLDQAPELLSDRVEKGALLDAYLQALAVYLSVKIDSDPPSWTHPAVRLPEPWFASPGAAIRNYLLISSPSPFRSRNLFIDEDSLSAV